MTAPDPFLGPLRQASGPRPPEGLAQRIADGAWERAAALRRERGRRLRRAVPWAAAAAGLLLTAVLLVGTRERAFAVEGDPVEVLRRGSWCEARTVPLDTWVRVPAGDRTLLAPYGGRISPEPGATLFLTDDAEGGGFRVDVRSGRAEVFGAALRVTAGPEFEVTRAAGTRRFRVQLTASGRDGGFAPRVLVLEGAARLRQPVSGDVLEVGAAQAAMLVRFSRDQDLRPALARLTGWSDLVPQEIASGRFVLGVEPVAPAGAALLLGGGGRPLQVVDLPADRVPAAVSQFVLLRSAMTPEPARPVKSVLLETEGLRVECRRFADGAIEIDEHGASVRRYADLDAALAAEPALLARVAPHLR